MGFGIKIQSPLIANATIIAIMTNGLQRGLDRSAGDVRRSYQNFHHHFFFFIVVSTSLVQVE